MNDKNDQAQNDDLDGFDTYQDHTDQVYEDDVSTVGDEADRIDDADFQDISDDLDAEVFGEGEPAPPPAKKSNKFNIAVAAVAVLVAGGLIAVKLLPTMMGGSADPAVQVATENTGNGEQAAQQAAQSPSAEPGVGLLDNPEQFAAMGTTGAQMVKDDTGPAIPDPFAKVSDASVGQPIAAPLADPAASTTPPMPAPIAPSDNAAANNGFPPAAGPLPAAAAPEAPVLSAQAPTLADTAIPEPQSTPVLAPVAAEAAAVRPIDQVAPPAGLEGKVTTLESRLDALDTKLTTALDRMASAQPAAAPVDDARLSSIQSALERLESRLDAMGTTARRKAQDVVAIVEDETPAPVKRATATKKTTVKTTAKKSSKTKAKANTGWDEPYTPSRTQNVSTGSGGSGGWELRGAQPGRAVIAKGGDIREVGVGDSVAGIGQVTGVANVNGAWVVQGTQGRVSQ